MNKITLVLIASLIAVSACDSNGTPNPSVHNQAMLQVSSQDRSMYLAYEHSLEIETTRESLQAGFDEVLSNCADDEEYECTILDSRINVGEYASATIRMRLLPEGVSEFVQIASGTGEMTARSTHVEDLEKSILDTNARISMLTATRDKLLEIEGKAADDVDSLIKITTELGRVQSELEQLQGRSVHQAQRVNKQLLDISYQTSRSRTFWAPISESLAEFGSNLSTGISDTVTAVAYLLPWMLLLLVLIFSVRGIWRRSRRR